MADKLTELKITQEDFDKNSIASLAKIPSRPSAFGASSLSADEVKKRFDSNPNLIRERFNALLSYLPNIAGDIKLSIGNYLLTLAELIASISSANNVRMQDLLMVSYGNSFDTLYNVISSLAKVDSDLLTDIGDCVQRMSLIDEARKAEKSTDEYYFSEKNWKAFVGDTASGEHGYNRLYVERSKGRGTYGMYALTYDANPIYNAWYSKSEWAERFAKEHPGEEFREPYDDEYPLLDSAAQRLSDGTVIVAENPDNPDSAAPVKYVHHVAEILQGEISCVADKAMEHDIKMQAIEAEISGAAEMLTLINEGGLE